jgi:putative transposase
MPRPLRIIYPNAWYHVMNRGASRQKIFKNDIHRLMFINLLKECQQMFNITLSAYCLMDNHYHLLLSTPDANLPRVMRHLNGIYTQLFNRSQKRDGSLFRGRYKAKLIDDDCYQLSVSRYIHLNPVDASIVTNPADYKWSSYRAYIGLENTPSWLSKSIILNQLTSIKLLSQAQNYQDYVECKHRDEIYEFHSSKFTKPIIGSEKFKEKILSQLDTTTITASATDYKRAKTTPTIDNIIKHICAFYAVTPNSLMHTKRGRLNWPRVICIFICRRFFGYSLRAIADCFECRYSANVSASFRKCELRLQANPDLQKELNVICDSIRYAIFESDLPIV